MGRGTAEHSSAVEGPLRQGFAAPPPHELRSQGGFMSYEPVADGELAAVVTYLEMRSPPDPGVPASPLSLNRVEVPAAGALPRAVPPGRRALAVVLAAGPGRCAPRLDHPAPEGRALFGARRGRREVGMIELDFRDPHECELSFIGLVPELSGKGHGRWLLAEAVRLAWREGVTAFTSTPARSIIRRHYPPIAAPVSHPSSERSSASLTRACSASCRRIARLRSRCSARSPERRDRPRAGRRCAPA